MVSNFNRDTANNDVFSKGLRMRKGFTLIELLVVIAIIAVLLSILLPSLRLARAQARQVVCGTNLRNVHRAMTFYAEDHNDYHHASWSNGALRFRPGLRGVRRLLDPYFVSSRGTGLAYWAQIYDEYLDSKHEAHYFQFSRGMDGQEFLPAWKNTRCPDSKYMLRAFRRKRGSESPNENGSGSSSDYFEHDPYTLWSTYAFNGVVPGAHVGGGSTPTFFSRKRIGGTTYWSPTRISSIRFPSEIIMAQDGAEVMMDGNGDTVIQLDLARADKGTSRDQWNNNEDPGWRSEFFRHPGGCTTVWVDGHVSMITPNLVAKEAERWYGALTRGGQFEEQTPLPWYTARN